MAVLKHDEIGQRFYETGVSKAVLFVSDGEGDYQTGVAWNGITAINESPTGAEESPHYADNIKYLALQSAETFEGTIEAFYSPAEFDQCDGMVELVTGVSIHMQNRKSFGFAYQSIIGNDTKKNAYGTKLHLWYGCSAAPSERANQTVNDSPEPANPSWSITSTPVDVPGALPTSLITIDSTKVSEENWKKIIDIIYGTESTDPQLPMPSEILELLKNTKTSSNVRKPGAQPHTGDQ